MTPTISIVDRGRGVQLSTNRITVLDLVPYFKRGCSYEEIRRWMPSLSDEEIAVVERYYREHQAAMDQMDQEAIAYRAEQIRLQRLRFPEEADEDRLERIKEHLRQHQKERNGEGHPGR